MNKFFSFALGLAVGTGMTFFGMKYHVVRATDGFHFVPKSKAKLLPFYADVRLYKLIDWQQNRDLLVDISTFGNDQLKEEAARSAVGNSFDSAWQDWTGGTP